MTMMVAVPAMTVVLGLSRGGSSANQNEQSKYREHKTLHESFLQ
jgi:hypothetical protein